MPDIVESATVNSSKYDADEMSLLMLIDDDMSDSEPAPPKSSSEYVISVSETAAAVAAAATAAAAAAAGGGGGTGGFKSEWHSQKLPTVATIKAPSNSNTIHWGPSLR